MLIQPNPLKTQIPILPVYIHNSNHKLAAFFRLKPIIIFYDQLFPVHEFDKKNKENTILITDQVLNKIKQIKQKILG